MNNISHPLQVGIIGTGFAANCRAEALVKSNMASGVAVSGNTEARLQKFASKYGLSVLNSWEKLVNLPNIDLVIICTVNNLHGAIAKAALEAGKHVIIEYPLSLNLLEAEELIHLAQEKNLLLHVEHIEIIGGLHQAIKENLPKIGKVFYARYVTVKIDNPAPKKWTYNHNLYGFPLIAAVSRIHRFTNLFGEVNSINCKSKFWNLPKSDYYSACLCQAQLKFNNGLIADITYGKGDKFWQTYRDFEINGEEGAIIFKRDKGTLITSAGSQEITIPSRQGLFQQDTEMVLNHLLTNSDLYVSNQDSCYALKIAEAARKSSETGLTIFIK
jgi:biliverdin reductase